MSCKNLDGQTDFLKPLEADLRMKEILPGELSKYFFFDGERIGNMSKDLRRGKSREFTEAVRNLLGLSAYTAAIYHLKGQGTSKSVLRSYDDQYDAKADNRILDYTQKIDMYATEIEQTDNRIIEIENEEELVEERIRSLSSSIKENESSKELAEQRIKFIKRRDALIIHKNTQTTELIKSFNKYALAYFSKKLMRDSLSVLSESKKLDKSVPDIHARTIDFIIEKGRCICGSEICIGNEAYNILNRLRDFIPPQSLGNLIAQFRLYCENNTKNIITFLDDFREKYSEICSFDGDYSENEEEISKITKHLEGMEDVGKMQAELTKYEKQQRNLKEERSELNIKKGSAETSRTRMETERHELTLKDKNNQRIEIYKAYAKYLYQYISDDYEKEETRVREELSNTVDEIFRSIYNGGFSLTLDSKYNVQVIVNDYIGYNGDVETSQSQSISIIFAFIAGVIKMARDSQNPENSMFVSEPYPLVMDAPLSAFDKTRIQTVCTVLPKIAEQVIIFIKDTDGEIAEKYLSDKIGSRAIFSKRKEFETYIEERS
jgi:DNA sulfur modification protein DndD